MILFFLKRTNHLKLNIQSNYKKEINSVINFEQVEVECLKIGIKPTK